MSQSALPPIAQIMQFAMGRWISQSLSVAAKLGIADLLAAGAVPVAELAAMTGASPDALFRILRALASVGVFTESAPGSFANTAASEILRSDSPQSMRNFAMMVNDPWQLANWSHLGECVQTGMCVPDIAGVDLFDQIGHDPGALATFQGAMTDVSRGAADAVVGSYDFSGIGTLADIAGGHGLLLTGILRANPALKGMLFERPEVAEGARIAPYLQGLESRVSVTSGDFFQGVPRGADAYMMKHILHDWSDSLCQTILKNIRAVLPGHGKLLLIESVIPPGNDPHPAKWIDIEMLVNTGGKDRTAEEWDTLLSSAGFRLSRIVPTPSLFCIVEGLPV